MEADEGNEVSTGINSKLPKNRNIKIYVLVQPPRGTKTRDEATP